MYADAQTRTAVVRQLQDLERSHGIRFVHVRLAPANPYTQGLVDVRAAFAKAPEAYMGISPAPLREGVPLELNGVTLFALEARDAFQYVTGGKGTLSPQAAHGLLAPYLDHKISSPLVANPLFESIAQRVSEAGPQSRQALKAGCEMIAQQAWRALTSPGQYPTNSPDRSVQESAHREKRYSGVFGGAPTPPADRPSSEAMRRMHMLTLAVAAVAAAKALDNGPLPPPADLQIPEELRVPGIQSIDDLARGSRLPAPAQVAEFFRRSAPVFRPIPPEQNVEVENRFKQLYGGGEVREEVQDESAAVVAAINTVLPDVIRSSRGLSAAGAGDWSDHGYIDSEGNVHALPDQDATAPAMQLPPIALPPPDQDVADDELRMN